MTDERTWTTCPVCHGVGASTETVTHSPGGVDTRTVTPCRACNGTGMVAAEVDDLPVEELPLHPADKLQLLCEAEMANKRIAELEAALAVLDSVLGACPPGVYESRYSGVCDACAACPAINRACWLGWLMWYGQTCGDGQEWEYRNGRDRSQVDRFVEPDEALRILNHHGLGDAANALRKEMDGDGY